MSIETFSPLPLNVFGTWVTLLDPSDVPPGMSPNLGDVDFFPGGVRTRPGLVSQFPVLGGAPQINGLKTYITTNLVQRLLVLDSLGNLYKETSPGMLSLVIAGGAAAESLSRLDHAFRPRVHGFRRRHHRPGPAAPIRRHSTSIASARSVPPKARPSPIRLRPATFRPACTSAWSCSSRARAFGPRLRRRFVDRGRQPQSQRHEYSHRPFECGAAPARFTASGGANFYNVPATMVINDNTTTSLTVDFTDTILLSGTSMDYLFSQIELPEQLGVAAYAERLFWWGERANMDNWRNLTFDGGWDASGNGRPLGWLLDPSFRRRRQPRTERCRLGRRLSHHRRRRHRRARI